MIGRLALAVALLTVAAACSSDSGGLPPPRSAFSVPDRSTTTRPDFSGAALPVVDGATTTTVPTTGGAVLQGVVLGAEGPVPGATVRVEFLVRDGVTTTDVFTAEDGTWQLPGIPGGRYRVRAFRAPDLAMPTGEVRYLVDGERVELVLGVEIFDGLEVRAGVTPEQPIVGGGVNLALRLTERSVDDAGIGISEPVPNAQVEIRASGWEPVGSNTDPIRVTDADGTAVWEFRCERVGPVTVVALVGPEGTAVPVEVPDCMPVPTTLPPSTVAPTTTAPG